MIQVGCGALDNRFDIDAIRVVVDLGQIAFNNLGAADAVRATDLNLLIEATRAQQGRIEDIRPIGGSHKQYVPVAARELPAKKCVQAGFQLFAPRLFSLSCPSPRNESAFSRR